MVDPAHVDLSGFHARRPALGRAFRLFGYLALAGVLVLDHRGRVDLVAWAIPLLVVAWLAAWRAVVGAAWRASLVAALLAAAVLVSLARLESLVAG